MKADSRSLSNWFLIFLDLDWEDVAAFQAGNSGKKTVPVHRVQKGTADTLSHPVDRGGVDAAHQTSLGFLFTVEFHGLLAREEAVVNGLGFLNDHQSIG